MLDTTKINYTYKKSLGKIHTNNDKEYYEELDGIVIHTHSSNIWIDAIPSTPIESESIKKWANLKLVEDPTVANRKSFYAVDENGNRITGFIPPSYGIDYTVKIYANGNKIPTSDKSQPLFDYDNGVLSFENTPPFGDITITAYQYVGETLAHFIDDQYNSVVRGVLGFDEPQKEYTIQHNLHSYDVSVSVYTYEQYGDDFYWKKDVVPMIILNEDSIKLELSEELPIRFIIKAYLQKSL